MINTDQMKLSLAAEIQRDFKIERIKKKALEVSQFFAMVTFLITFLILSVLI